MTKKVYTLNIGNFAPTVTDLTYPLMRRYARKIDAEFVEITERRFEGWPIPVEKFQIWRLAHESPAHWHIFFDADTLIHPECIDWTAFLPRDTVAQNGHDFGSIRHRYDVYRLRDGRNISTCGWCTIASDWCLDLWHPPDDITVEEATEGCQCTVPEINSGVMDDGHLVDDYLMSRNVARYGLKYITLLELNKRLFPPQEIEREEMGEVKGHKQVIHKREEIPRHDWFTHVYMMDEPAKLRYLRQALDAWKVPDALLDGADLSWRASKENFQGPDFDRMGQAEMGKDEKKCATVTASAGL